MQLHTTVVTPGPWPGITIIGTRVMVSMQAARSGALFLMVWKFATITLTDFLDNFFWLHFLPVFLVVLVCLGFEDEVATGAGGLGSSPLLSLRLETIWELNRKSVLKLINLYQCSCYHFQQQKVLMMIIAGLSTLTHWAWVPRLDTISHALTPSM